MKRITFTYGVGYGRHHDDMEVEDDATDGEIEQMVKEAVFEKLDWSWRVDEE